MSLRFAPITAALLTRKSSYPSAQDSRVLAAPVEGASRANSAPAALEPPDDGEPVNDNRDYSYAPDHPLRRKDDVPLASPDKPRRLVLTLTPHEYDVLGHAAVKKNTTRHVLAQKAISAYFDLLAAEYGETCSCMISRTPCQCGPSGSERQ